MKKILVKILLLSIFTPCITNGQTVTFNKELILNDQNVPESLHGIVELDNGYILTGFTKIDDSSCGLVITRVSKTGEVIWVKTYGGTPELYMKPGVRNPIIKTSDGNIAIALTYNDTLYSHQRTMILKANLDGEILWTNVLNDTLYNDKYTAAQGLIETNDHGFALYAQIQIMGILYKTDSLGQMEWYKTFGNDSVSNYVYLYSVEQLTDSSYVVGASNMAGGVANSGLAKLYKIDHIGNYIWSRSIDGPYQEYGSFVKWTEDSIIISVCSFATEPNAGNNVPNKQKICISYFSENGDHLGDKLLGSNDARYTINSLEVMYDGTLLAAGTGPYYEKTWLFNFRLNGDSLFYKEYSYPIEWDTLLRIIDAKPAMDGGIIACGEFSYPIGSIYTDNAWLLKTDRYGCFQMGCDSMALYILNQPQPLAICKGQVAEFNLSNWTENCSYKWQVHVYNDWFNIEDGFLYSGTSTNSLYINTEVLIPDINYYRCNLYNSYWSIYTDTVSLILKENPQITSQPKDTTTVVGDLITLSIETFSFDPVTFQWFKDNSLIPYANESTFIIDSIELIHDGYYHCITSNDCGTTESDHVRIEVKELGLNNSSNSNISVSPNPVKSSIRIKTDRNIIIEIYNSKGILMETIYNCQSRIIDLSTFGSGFYYFIFKNDKDHIIETKKIIKY